MVNRLKSYFYQRFKTSFSKSGEDIQLWQLLKKDKGTYIDIGGHHPIFGNNSFFFYIRNWRGIVVEPNPVFKKMYWKYRPKDILISDGIADFDGELDYFEFESSVFNSFSKEHLGKIDLLSSVRNVKSVPVKKLSTVVMENGFNNLTIDFLSIDVEGLEMEVLRGNNWHSCRPRYILLESHQNLKDDLKSEISSYLDEKDYSLIGKSMLSNNIGTLWYKSNENVI
ncbi:FkbM family methyltransferase [Algoriphagus mannitolivorans]|uniref:FkbM family methyltransferase n=1 Tax=Algoriphagus mannitolivorans TaxID=226504 RepID=UPI000414B7C5|nr:FkbM family methyltransferase [Algoriphagus mannitolivorans]